MSQDGLSKPSSNAKPFNSTLYGTYHSSLIYWTFTAAGELANKNISKETKEIIAELRQCLSRLSLDPTSIVSTVIILRSMRDFVAVNKVMPPSQLDEPFP
jgi:enamine deaminase RidA (YjgF/YER057c/UK114 family)